MNSAEVSFTDVCAGAGIGWFSCEKAEAAKIKITAAKAERRRENIFGLRKLSLLIKFLSGNIADFLFIQAVAASSRSGLLLNTRAARKIKPPNNAKTTRNKKVIKAVCVHEPLPAAVAAGMFRTDTPENVAVSVSPPCVNRARIK